MGGMHCTCTACAHAVPCPAHYMPHAAPASPLPPSSCTQPPLSQLPQFYFPSSQQNAESTQSELLQRINKHYEASPSGLGMEEFTAMASEVGAHAHLTCTPCFHSSAGAVLWTI